MSQFGQSVPDARDDQQWRVIRRRVLTPSGNRVNLAVTTGATSVTIPFTRTEPDTAYGVVVSPSWSTTTYWSGKSKSQLTINFGTAAPAGALIDVHTFRSEG